MECKIYKVMCGEPGFPYIYHYSKEEDTRVLVIELMGPSLERLFTVCGSIFSQPTVCFLAVQMLSRLESFHGKTFIHRDQKPDNYCIGLGTGRRTVYLIDYGLAKRYMAGGSHIAYRERKALTGTVRYCSVNTQLGVEQSRRDDLESLGYILVYFARGSLPWQGLRAAGKKERYQRILEKKLQTPVTTLCAGLPPAYTEYVRYCRALRFRDTPDYGYLRALFRQAAPPGLDWERLGVDTDGLVCAPPGAAQPATPL